MKGFHTVITRPLRRAGIGLLMGICSGAFIFTATASEAAEHSDAYYELLELYADYQATTCKFDRESVSSYSENTRKTLTIADLIARQVEITASGRLTPTDLQALGALQQQAQNCGSPIEIERRKAKEAFFDIKNQQRLYCLSREERVKAYMDYIRSQNPGLTNESLLTRAEDFIRDFDRHMEQRDPDSAKRLCEAGNR